jgi:hypothetical protein
LPKINLKKSENFSKHSSREFPLVMKLERLPSDIRDECKKNIIRILFNDPVGITKYIARK